MGVKTVIITHLSLKIFLFLVFNLLSSTVGQNCGVPSVINVTKKDILRETLDTGQLLTKIKAWNVVEIAGEIQNPDNFTVVELTKEEGIPFLTLHVNQPLWDKNLENPRKSYIDFNREENVEVIVNLTCFDGNHKKVTFQIPIIDENTEKPHFEHPEYDLFTEPCITGSCVMLFDVDIVVIDEDRDELNAFFEVDVDMEEIVIITDFNTIEPWYEEDKSLKIKRRKGFHKVIRLGYTPKEEHWMPTCSINFTLTARNKEIHVDGSVYESKTLVHVTFDEKPGRMLPPLFSSFYYHAEAEYADEYLRVKPREISASVPWKDSSKIFYRLEGEVAGIISIDPEKGSIFFHGHAKLPFLMMPRTIISFKNRAIPYTVVAERHIEGKEDIVQARAPLTVFVYVDDKGNNTTPIPPTCPPVDCDDTPIPLPGTCPTIPTCPDPCPITKPPMTLPTDPPIYPTAETEEPTTTDFEETEDPTTEETELPTTIYTEPPSWPPTSSGTPSTSTSSASTYPPTSTPQDTEPPSTSESSSLPTSKETESPTTSESPATSDSTSTSESSSSPTSKGTESPSTIYTDPPSWPPTGSASPSTTTYPSTTTTYSSASPPLTSTAPPTFPPGDGVCDCDEFTCRNPQANASDSYRDYIHYPDPFECTRYHLCPTEFEEDPDESKVSINCTEGEVYCPINAKCTTLQDCLSLSDRFFNPISISRYGYGDVEYEEDDPSNQTCDCRVGIPPGDPRNLCNDSNHEELLEDPEYCDIFHQCQETLTSEYIDFPKKCQAGLIFCPRLKVCVRYDESECACPSTKMLKQCDVCIMGRWTGFDVFTKRFTYPEI